MLALVHDAVGVVSSVSVALVLSLRVFFVKYLLSSWYCGVGVALALPLAWLLLRDYGSLGPRSLLPVLWWRCPFLLAWTVPCFSLGAWSLVRASSSVAFHPSPSLGLARLVDLGLSSLFEMVSLFFHGIVASHFSGISRSVFGGV